MITFLVALLTQCATAAEIAKPVDVCWGYPESRCYTLDQRSISQSLRGTPMGRRALKKKEEAVVRKTVDDFVAWAAAKKAAVTPTQARICRDVMTVRAGRPPVLICLDALPKKELKVKHDALMASIQGKR